jgi:hypothetical protein
MIIFIKTLRHSNLEPRAFNKCLPKSKIRRSLTISRNTTRLMSVMASQVLHRHVIEKLQHLFLYATRSKIKLRKKSFRQDCSLVSLIFQNKLLFIYRPPKAFHTACKEDLKQKHQNSF